MNRTISATHNLCIMLLFIFSAIILLINTEVKAEGIFLHDGRVVYGKILSQGDNTMEVRTSFGIIKLQKSDIKKIDYDLGLGTVTVVMRNGTLIDGTLISITAAKIIVKDENIDTEIPRAEIENLILHKFEGYRDNTFGIMGGVTYTTSSIKEQTPYSNIDLTAFYLKALPSTPYFLWGLSASYIKLKTEESKTNLEDADMTLNPLMVDLRLKYPLLSLISSSDWAAGIDFFVNAGAGVSYVTLKEGNDSRSGMYYSFQPAFGISMNIGESLYLVNQYDYLYIHQKELPYTGCRVRLGVGYIF